ncbi:MAG: UvrD-helicase domain-containing protein [Candidatus Nomurabacteria bacterium]|nr:UvrD-helicase domain-containing protein [Candidatus Nomurabacteria bacterium]
MEYLNTLNEKQREAVLYTQGPLLIVAGAGAGKTKTLTHRIVHIVHGGVKPENILAVTFTNKAAKEMRERVIGLLSQRENGAPAGGHSGYPFVSTFHALGVRIIKENAHLLGLTKHFVISDDDDCMKIIKESLKARDIDPKQYEPRKIKNIISRAKGDFINLDRYANEVKSGFESVVATIWRDYERTLKAEKALDFDDLLIETVMILKKYPEVKLHYQNQWQYIHVDEYQDTNEVQYEMVKLLVGPRENICVVGDTDQNIYSWRGANIKNMLHFEKDYPRTKIVMLEQNYRSTKNIIEAANNVINKNIFRVPKTLFTEKETGEDITVYEAFDEVYEGKYVANQIHELLRENKPEDIAILYRANFQSRVLEEAMLSKNIPYQVLGTKFFDRREIKDVLSYLRAALNRDSLSDIKRVINTPARGIGKVTLVKLFSGGLNDLPASMQMKISNFYTLLDNIHEFAMVNKPSDIIKFIIEKSGLEDELKKGTSDDLERLENMKELVTLAVRYDGFDIEEGIDKILEDAALSSDQDSLINKPKPGGVRLMTVHASKGLEFPYVFITGLEKDLFPHSRPGGGKKEDSEEERRLFYVALTRAEKKLYLCHASLRTIFGMKQVNTPSEFLEDIPSHLVKHERGGGNGEKIIYI